jgi:hypothetical protein
MKFRSLATASTSLLGAALVGYGQTQTEQRPDHPVGAPATEQTSGAAGASTTPPIPGTAHDRGPTDDPRDLSQPRDGLTGSVQQQQRAAAEQQAGQQQAGQQQAGQQPQELEGTEAERAALAEQRRQMAWHDAEESPIQFNELPQRARNTLEVVTAEGEMPQQVVRLTKEDHEIYRATFARQQAQDLHIFVQNDGTVIQTKQQIEFTDAPQTVRNAIRSELNLEGDAQPEQQIHRIIVGDETHYALAPEGDQGRMVHIDSGGQLVERGDRQVQDVQAGAQPGAPTENPRNDQPAARDDAGQQAPPETDRPEDTTRDTEN